MELGKRQVIPGERGATAGSGGGWGGGCGLMGVPPIPAGWGVPLAGPAHPAPPLHTGLEQSLLDMCVG